MKNIIAAVILIIFFSFALADELSPNYSGWWINLGVGASAGSQLVGPAAELSLNYAPSQNRLWTLRALEAANLGGMFANSLSCEFLVTSGEQFNPSSCVDDRSAGEIGAMYGLMSKSDFGYISGSAGLGLVALQTPSIYINNVKVLNGKTTYTPGAPLEIQAFWTPFKYMGLGIIDFGDLNTHKSFGGALLALQFGILK